MLVAPSPVCLQELIPPTLPIISVSKGIEVTTGQLMSEVIPSVLGKKQPTVYLSGGHRRGMLACVCRLWRTWQHAQPSSAAMR